MGLNRELLARSLMHEAFFQVRFGEDAESAARSAAILARIDERGGDAPGMSLARAAHALAGGDPAAALSSLGGAENGTDPYASLIAGYAMLAQAQPAEAAAAFRRSLENGGAARAQWGLARALLAAGDEGAAEAVEATLTASPRHAAALLAKADLAYRAEDFENARLWARQAAGSALVGETRLRVEDPTRASAWALAGRVAERQGNRGEARMAYEAAIEADAFRLDALVGVGRALLSDERYRDALTRFESAIQSASTNEVPAVEGERPILLEAQLGAARAMIELDREQDAQALLAQLAQAEADDWEIALWLGRANETLDDDATAEANYRDAIRLAPDRFEPYLALAQLFFGADRENAATEVLEQARAQVPESAEMRRLLGASELRRGNLEQAIVELTRALELDPRDVTALYTLGVAHRRNGNLDAANEAYARVSEVDPSYPGLAIERGRVFEARGEPERAVEAYRLALEGRPDDPDLLLRLGAAYVESGNTEEAAETLRRVQESLPNSPEAEHFMGRVELARGNLPVALNHFSRAVNLDASRGEYHLYVAWASLEMGNLGRALEEVNEALTRDPALGDAYWIRGRIRVNSGAVQDALADLERALQLKPSRFEAYAAMAECYDQLREVSRAVTAYERALERDNSRGDWWYRLGRLQLDAGRRRDAIPSLDRAVLIGDAQDPPPAWLADAHRLLGNSRLQGGDRAAGVRHLQRYLEIAPANAIDRNDVRDMLMRMGVAPQQETP
jgi:tetratricopeptide (TPR) repeat protein